MSKFLMSFLMLRGQKVCKVLLFVSLSLLCSPASFLFSLKVSDGSKTNEEGIITGNTSSRSLNSFDVRSTTRNDHHSASRSKKSSSSRSASSSRSSYDDLSRDMPIYRVQDGGDNDRWPSSCRSMYDRQVFAVNVPRAFSPVSSNKRSRSSSDATSNNRGHDASRSSRSHSKNTFEHSLYDPSLNDHSEGGGGRTSRSGYEKGRSGGVTIKNMSSEEIYTMYANRYFPDEIIKYQDLMLENHGLYHLQNYVVFLRVLPGYEDYILDLDKKFIRHTYRKRYRDINGFGKRGFVEWIQDEAKRIRRIKEVQQTFCGELSNRFNAPSYRGAPYIFIQADKIKAWQEKDSQEMLQAKKQHAELMQKNAPAKQDVFDELSLTFNEMKESVVDEQGRMLVSLGMEYTLRGQQASLLNQHANVRRYVERAKAIEDFLGSFRDEESCQRTYELTYDASIELDRVGIDHVSFASCLGNRLQQCLHRELVDTINETTKLKLAFCDDVYIGQISTLMYHVADSAYAYNEKQQFSQGFALADVCASFLSVGKKFARAVSAGFDCIKSASGIIAKGMVYGLQNYSLAWKDFIDQAVTDPFTLVCEISDSISEASLMVGKALVILCTDPQEFTKQASNIITLLASEFNTDQEEATIKAMALVTEFLLSGITCHVGMKKAGDVARVVKELTRFVKVEARIASLTSGISQQVQKVFTPIRAMCVEAVGVAKVGFEKGQKTFQEVFDLLLFEPQLALVHGSIEEAIAIASKHVTDFKEYKQALHLFYKAKDSGTDKKVIKGIKGLIKKHKLPTKGKIRYVPPKNIKLGNDLPKRILPNEAEGFVDRFGNVWIKGTSRTKTQWKEWDVQLSRSGKRQFRWLIGKNKNHLNVSLDGKITHI